MAWILPFLYPQYLHLLKFAHLHLGQLKQTNIYQGKFCTGKNYELQKQLQLTLADKLAPFYSNDLSAGVNRIL